VLALLVAEIEKELFALATDTYIELGRHKGKQTRDTTGLLIFILLSYQRVASTSMEEAFNMRDFQLNVRHHNGNA
jgi:hypothetical protein